MLPRIKESIDVACGQRARLAAPCPRCRGFAFRYHVQSAARTIASPFATCASFCSWPQPIIGGGAHSSTLHGRRFECKRCGYAGYVAPPPPHHVSTGVHVQLRAVYGIGGPGWLHEVGLHLRTTHGERCLVCFVEYAAVLVDSSLPPPL